MTTPTESISTSLRSGAFAGQWSLKPDATTVTLKTKAMFGIVPVTGTFDKVHGSATVGSAGQVDATIHADVSSLSTKMKKRDEHLKSADFFDAANHPSITVAITGVDASLVATGTLTVKGSSVPITFPVVVGEAGDHQITLDATFDVDRSEVGLDFRKMGATKMKNTVSVHATFTRS